MEKTLGSSDQTSLPKMPAALWSLASMSITVNLASISHAEVFGHHAYIIGLLGVVLLFGMVILYQRTKRKVILASYGVLGAWIVIGFGLVDGFWNHAFKVFLYNLHSGSLPPFLARMFMRPAIGSFASEGVGVLTFVMSMVAACYGYKFMKEGR